MELNTEKQNGLNDLKVIPLDNSFIKENHNEKKVQFPKSRGERLKEFCKTFVVEPFMYSFVFSMHIRSVCTQNLLLDKACLVDLHYPDNICNNIHHPENVDAKNKVQILANNIHMYSMLIHIIPSALCTIVLGPWSDKYSRKYPIILSTVGMLLDIAIIIIFTIDFRSPAIYLLFAAIPSGLGGIMVTITCIYSYLSDITTPENRTLRYAILDLGFHFAGPIGTALGGILFEYYGYMPVFVTSFVAQLGGLIFLMARMKEPKHENLKKDYRAAFKALFSLDNIKDSIKTCTKKREGNVRKEMWLLFLSMCSIIVCFLGTLGVRFLFTQKMFNWSVAKFSVVNTIIVVGHGIAMLIFVPIFTKRTQLHDILLVLIGVTSMAAYNAVKGFATQEWVYYFAAVLGLLSGLASVGLRARLSKIVPKDEIGKVFSVLALTESLTPLIGIIVFAQIYNASIAFFPGLVFEVASAFLLIPIGVSIWVYKVSPPYEVKITRRKDSSTEEIKMVDVF